MSSASRPSAGPVALARDAAAAVRLCLVRYLDVEGRSSRFEYWAFVLFALAAQKLMATADAALFGIDHMGGPLGIATALALAAPTVAVATRRLHDVGRSAWWLLLAFVPVVGVLALLYVFLQPGDRNRNAYGPPPSAPAGAPA
ncbi:MAG: DUF805 domain-containing protein [Pseudomonadota bacterium]